MAKPRKLPTCRSLAVGHHHACLIRFGQPLDPARERGRPPGDAKLGCKLDAVDPPRIT